MQGFRSALLGAILVGVASSQSHAAIVTYGFTGHVTYASPQDPSRGFVAGAPIVGRFGFDTALPMTNGLPGSYSTGQIDAALGVLSLTAKYNDIPLALNSFGSWIGLVINSGSYHGFGIVAGTIYEAMTLAVLDSSHSFFPPSTVPTLADFDPAAFFQHISGGDPSDRMIRIEDAGGAPRVEGVIDSLYLVPEPASALLLSLALAAVPFCRSRQRLR